MNDKRMLLTLRIGHLLGFVERSLDDLAGLVGEVVHVCDVCEVLSISVEGQEEQVAAMFR